MKESKTTKTYSYIFFIGLAICFIIFGLSFAGFDLFEDVPALKNNAGVVTCISGGVLLGLILFATPIGKVLALFFKKLFK